jgi:transcription-repair coupling factor (superfamily II helicase)
MKLAGLLDLVASDAAVSGAASRARAGDSPASLDLTGPTALRPFVAAAVAAAGRPVLAVTATTREADELAAALRCLMDADRVAVYPAWETLPHERLSPRADTVGRRLAVLRRLRHPSSDDPAHGPIDVLVAPIRSVLQPQVAGLADLAPIALAAGDDVAFDDVVTRLVDIGYARVDLVERRGEFAVRGGIIDVFPPTDEHPVRVEFWGDSVEEVRSFAVADQRSLPEGVPVLWAPPCREMLLTPDVRARAKQLSTEQPGLADILEMIADGNPVEGMESLAPVLVDHMTLLLDEVAAGTHVLVCDPERVRTRAAELVRTSQEFLEASWAVAAGGGTAPIDLGGAAYRSVADVRAYAGELGVPWWTLAPFSTDEDDDVVISAAEAPSYRGDTEAAVADIRGWVGDGYRVVLVTAGHGPAQRLVEILSGADVPATLVESIDARPRDGIATVVPAGLAAGFVSDGLQLAVLTEGDLYGTRATRGEQRKLPTRRRKGIDPLQLKPGDYVVHDQHGVGTYVELTQRTVAGATREYLVLEYAKGDRLYVPTDSLDIVSRYTGGEQPSLDRIGGADWAKRKGKARKAVKEIAAELIRLYSARMASPGYAFGPDTPWQREMEDAFPYTETPDQLAAINDVKRDMESPVPMDRLICGDVGYGKTEIAVRAAFKAVMDGKQAAVLVPTTLLAQQHFATLTERFSGFPVNVQVISRFNSAKEQNAVLAGVADGSVDVVVGTHRLLGKSVQFKNLALVIVDEEQRFGVEHKEFLKHMRANVDVLAMSATPIPRTLEMAVTGIRELSTIDTPPEERHPILTFVGAYDDRQITAAIRRELLRDGQVFYLHNRVESIDKAAKRITELVPEARVLTAHGQMGEDALEKVMVDFYNRDYDVLVSTTIVESGLDVPNANTLIVERADLLGLSQLHQIRGRVGRGRERAYAYFLYPVEKPLTETAIDRLATIAQHTDLGAGMAVAMKDLEIRGAGNLLGGEQSGHIASVGFDMYIRLVGEAVADFKGEHVDEEPEVKLDLAVDAHLPHDYIPGERLRLDAYRRLAEASSDADVEAVREELLDRYGLLPEPVANLLAVASLRAYVRRFGVAEISGQGNFIRFAPWELRDSQQLRLSRLYPGSVVKAPLRTVLVPRPMTARVAGQPVRDTALLNWVRAVLDGVTGEPLPAAAS